MRLVTRDVIACADSRPDQRHALDNDGETAVTETNPGSRYLVYINRSHLDVPGGIFGSWKRTMVEGRLRSESANVFNEVRKRLESGPPLE
jgi:hypothetical protein